MEGGNSPGLLRTLAELSEKSVAECRTCKVFRPRCENSRIKKAPGLIIDGIGESGFPLSLKRDFYWDLQIGTFRETGID